MKKKNKDQKAIDAAIKALEKRFGEPVLMRMNEAKAKIETISSGRPDLDVALGGGYAVGKIIEIFAQEAAGKTGLALEAIAKVQELGGVAAIIDAEHALNVNYAKLIGVNIDDLYISQPSYGEQAFETIRAMINSAQFDLIVVDSVSALQPRAVIEGESGEAKMAALARLMSQGMTLISSPAAKIGTTIIFLNQMRSTLSMYGSPQKPTGGNALKFFASQRLEIKNKGKILDGTEVIGFKQYIKVVKNKVIAPFKWIENDIIYGKGVSGLNGMIEALVEREILTKKGSWFWYGETKLANGMKKFRALLEDNPELLEELKSKL